METRMSSDRGIKRKRPGFGKRGGGKIEVADRKLPSAEHWGQICRRWLGKKAPPRAAARKGFGFKRPQQPIR